ncbi:MAG: Maf family protein [Flavobacteriales bacterium]
MKIVLGSASPRRSELLRQLGVDFRILKADCSEEFNPQDTPEQIVQSIAQQKSDALMSEIGAEELLICADTIVYLNHEVIGKPIDSTDAIRLLQQLSGNSHDVFTGVILRNQEKTVRFTVKTSVYFRSLRSSEIEHYVKHFQPLDKAGSYGIQDWIGLIGVEKIEGSYTNVMGLPTQELYLALQNF